MNNKNLWRLASVLVASCFLMGGGMTACKKDDGAAKTKTDPLAKTDGKNKTGDGPNNNPPIVSKPFQKGEPKPAFPVSDLKVGDTLELPYILWGGDVATFLANGGKDTVSGSIFDKQGLKIKLIRHPDDDFEAQVKAYAAGTTPFLRGTMSMLGQWAEQLGKDPRTHPVVFLQLTWSAGDHLVARGNLKTLDDLRGKTIAIQDGGPHVGMLHDILNTARLGRGDINVVTTTGVAGDKGPAALFAKDDKIDACFAITPEMSDLTGGLDKRGDGTAKSVKGAHVLVSTAHMSRSIVDVYACRKDYYDRHRDKIEKFAAGYLKACEELIAMKKAKTPAYEAVKKMTQDLLKGDVPTPEDAAGLIDDATFVGLPGNIRFFTDAGNLSGFRAKQAAALNTAYTEGNINQKTEFIKCDFDYERIRQLGQLASKVSLEPRFRKLKALPTTDDAIFSFTIGFQPNQAEFSAQQYGPQFQRALEMASLFGNAKVYIRGHADPAFFLGNVLHEGITNNVLRSASKDGSADIFLGNGSKLDITNVKQVANLVQTTPSFVLAKNQLDNLRKLSNDRANEVNRSVVNYAKNKGYVFDQSQIDFEGVGILEPAVARIRLTDDEAQRNRRVEFRIVRIPVGELPPDDDGFDR